jgi:hypothetical protein
MPKKKPPAPARLKITHSWPKPRPDDGARFIELIRKMVKLGTTS